MAHTLGVSMDEFERSCFSLAVDTEKMSSVSASGLNVQGVEMRCDVTGFKNGAGVTASRCWFHCHHQIFLELRAGSVTVLS